jgi:hypothetical protein
MQKEFNLGGGLTIKLNEAPTVFWGPVNINVWRELMPEGTLRSGLETVNWNLDFDDFRSDRRALNAFLDKISRRLNRKVYLFKESDLDPNYVKELIAVGGAIDSFMITIRK